MNAELTVKLYQQLHNGSNRKLTRGECASIRACKTSVQPTTSNAWRLECSDDGFYSVRAFARNGDSASWALDVVVSKPRSAKT